MVKKLILWVVLVIITGCNPVPEMPILTPGEEIPTLAISPTKEIFPTSIPSVTPSTPVEEFGDWGEECSGIVVEHLSQGISPSMIVFKESNPDYTNGSDDKLFSFSPLDLELSRFMDDFEPSLFADFHVSPDRRWMVFAQERRIDDDYISTMIVTTSNDQNRIIQPWDEENWSYVIQGWLADGQRLVIAPRHGPDDEIILFNPFTASQERLLPAFTYPENSYRLEKWGVIGLSVVYDPTMTRVVYMVDDRTMVLWDLEEHKQLWRFEEPVLMKKEIPTWSPNGEYLAVFDLFGNNNRYLEEGDEFQVLLVHRSGEVVWRSEHYPFFDWYYNSMDFNWSPNGEYLVFDWVVDEEGNHHTFVLNVDSQELSEYCFRGSVPVWSPDSRQFIMKLGSSDPMSEEWDNSGNVVVNVESGEIYLLEDIKYWPKAWLITEEAE